MIKLCLYIPLILTVIRVDNSSSDARDIIRTNTGMVLVVT